MIRTTFAAIFAACLFFGLSSAAQAACSVPDQANQLATNLLSATNQLRSSQGRGQLAVDRRLSQAAQALACDIQRTGRISHTSSDGASVGDRVRRTGYSSCLTAENLAWGYPRATQIVSGWNQSPGHHRNMLHPRVREAGIGIAQGSNGPIWVMVYASAC